jgi:hypothetical protein
MSHQKAVRRQLFVDLKIQGPLMLRVILHWVIGLLTVALMLLCWQILTGPKRPLFQYLDAMWFYCGPAALASFLLLPLVLVGLARFSNRFLGPFLRLRWAMRELAQGEPVEPIEFRRGDFWREFAEEFNALAARVQGELSQPPGQFDPGKNAPEPISAVSA